LHVGRARKSRRDTRNTTIYTGSGLQRVKLYVQFGGRIMRERSTFEEGSVDVPLRGTPGRLILAGVPWVTSWFVSILVGYTREILSGLVCLVLYSMLSSCPWAHISGWEGPLTGRWVFWQVGPAYRGRLRPWSVGTHGYLCFSSSPSTCTHSDRGEVWRRQGRVGCTGIQKKKTPFSARTKSNIELLGRRSRRSK
jgi:hypothetical protein